MTSPRWRYTCRCPDHVTGVMCTPPGNGTGLWCRTHTARKKIGNSFTYDKSSLDYFGFIFCPFHTMEYVAVGSFLIAISINIKVRTHFEQYF